MTYIVVGFLRHLNDKFTPWADYIECPLGEPVPVIYAAKSFFTARPDFEYCEVYSVDSLSGRYTTEYLGAYNKELQFQFHWKFYRAFDNER